MRKLPSVLILALTATAFTASSTAEAQPPKPPKPTKYGFVVNKFVVRTFNDQARAVGLDLNGDGEVDNQFGQVLASLAAQGFDVQGPVDAAASSGSLVTLLVTDQELRDSALIQSLLAPDLDYNGDGEGDALSVGIGFTAVNATVRGG